MPPLDRIILHSATAQVGAFTCATSDPRFRDSGPVERHLVVFPRSGVWIRHAGSGAFVADPNVLTIYNRGQEYTRKMIGADGDRCDWFGVSEEVAREIVRTHDPRAADDADRPFRYQVGRCPPELYLRQRACFHRLERGGLDPLEAEESAIGIVASAIGAAYGAADAWRAPSGSYDAQLDLVERARADIVTRVRARTTLSELAARLSASPFHLCRVFRRLTGMTLRAYRLELRQRLALEPLASDRITVSRIAADLGFASHSHLTATLRSRVGLTPTRLRRVLRAGLTPNRPDR